jgi:hypothetical protein
MIKHTLVMLAAGLALLFSGTVAHAADSGNSNNTSWGKFDQGKQGDAKGGLERTAGKKVEEVKVPDVPAPQPVETSTTTAGGYSVGTSTGTKSGN